MRPSHSEGNPLTADQPPYSSPPRLKPPGAGIPLAQRLVARWVLLPLELRRTPWEGVPAKLSAQGRELENLLTRACAKDDGPLQRRVLISPAPGLEDDSRYWSIAMVFDHLRRVNERATEIVRSLSEDRPLPTGPSQIVDFKPDPNAARLAVSDYRSGLARFISAVEAVPPGRRNPAGTVPHPWFGPLRLRQWVGFVPIHQALHTTQMRRIVAGLEAGA